MNTSTTPIRLIGMGWFLAEDFAQIKAVMKDGYKLHRTHAEWQAAAENGERNMRGQGCLVYRAIIRPEPFLAWCKAQGLEADAQARNRFAAEFAKHEYEAGR